MNKFLKSSMWFINIILCILFDERGEANVEGEGTEGGNEDPAKDEKPTEGTQDQVKDDNAGEDQKSKDEAIAEWAGYASKDELIKAHETMKGQTGATEKNLRSLRQALKKHGLTYDPESGEFAVLAGAQQQKQKRVSKFNDEVKNKLNNFFMAEGVDEGTIVKSRDEFLNVLKTFVDDIFEEHMETYQTTAAQKIQERKEWNEKYSKATKELFESFPSLNPEGQSFNQAFNDSVIEYLDENPELRKQPDGELIAAERIARRMQISPVAIGKARKEGFEKGKEVKKIVSQKDEKTSKGATAFKRLSKDEYLALSSEEKDAYNKKLLEI